VFLSRAGVFDFQSDAPLGSDVPHFHWMLLVVKEDEPFDPVCICLKGAWTQVAQGSGCPGLV
jgi:hypothetical protein